MPRSLQARLPTLHIYRNLLREASYLPPICQPFVRQQILNRFRKHHHDPPAAPETKRRIKKAQHDLRHLWAANHGLMSNMFRVLLLSFGRLGKRRRDLVRDLLQHDPPADSTQLQEQIARQASDLQGRRPDWLDQWNQPKLLALATSQARRSFYTPKPELKSHRLNPKQDVPEENSWGRPTPAKLARSKLRKFYKRLINRVMAPVGRQEWDTLAQLATGRADKSLTVLPTRRPRASSLYGHDDDKRVWDWKAYATHPVRAIERGSSRSQKARTGEEGEAPYGLGRATGLHKYNRSRLWKRMYTKIWEMTPTMAKAPGEERWTIDWGQASRAETPVAGPAQLSFFEGAPEMPNKKRHRKKGEWKPKKE